MSLQTCGKMSSQIWTVISLATDIAHHPENTIPKAKHGGGRIVLSIVLSIILRRLFDRFPFYSAVVEVKTQRWSYVRQGLVKWHAGSDFNCVVIGFVPFACLCVSLRDSSGVLTGYSVLWAFCPAQRFAVKHDTEPKPIRSYRSYTFCVI